MPLATGNRGGALILAGLLSLAASSFLRGLCCVGPDCGNGKPITVTHVADPFVTTEKSEFRHYEEHEVLAHVEAELPLKFASPITTTFTCIDARVDHAVLGTPGGDFVEFVMALHVYYKQQGVSFDQGKTVKRYNWISKAKYYEQQIEKIFNQFMDEMITPDRPFFYHTDESRLRQLYANVAAAGVYPAPSVLPPVMPTNMTELDIWYSKWIEPEVQGCGHLRMMLHNHEQYGLESTFIPETMLRAYLKYYWTYPPGSAEHSKLAPVIALGFPQGSAVTIISKTGQGCRGLEPLVQANNEGSSVYVYHENAAKTMRAHLLVPWFTTYDSRVTPGTFLQAMNDLAKKQVQATLRLLPGANMDPIFSVQIEAAEHSACGHH